MPEASSEATPGERFNAVIAAVVRRLPFGLANVVAPSFLGFVVINGCTFSLDLGLLTVFHGVLGWPLPLGITLSYLIAFALSFVLNRSLNFRSHANLGSQTAVYAVAVGINYVAFILGVGAGTAALGVEYHVARIMAGACEAVYMYCVMRWVVFRGPATPTVPAAPEPDPALPEQEERRPVQSAPPSARQSATCAIPPSASRSRSGGRETPGSPGSTGPHGGG